MANLANKTTEWLKVEDMSGGSDSPFDVSYGGDIEFDVNWRPLINRNIFDDDSEALKFYEKIGIPKDWVKNLLNRTYKRYKSGA